MTAANTLTPRLVRRLGLACALAALTAGAAHAGTDWDKVNPEGQKVSFWFQYVGPKQAAMQKLIADFNKENPWHITVTGSYQGGYGDIEKKMLPLLGTSAMPDLTVAYQNSANTYRRAHAVIDMNGLVDSKKWGLTKAEQDNFIPAIWASDISPIYKGERLGFPTQRSVQVMYYNEAWLKKLGADAPPATPAEFKALACKASKEGDGKMGYVARTDASAMAGWIFAFGGNFFDTAKMEYTFTSPAALKAMDFLSSLGKDGCAQLQAQKYGNQAAFGQGKSLFTVDTSSSMTYYAKTVKDGKDFPWTVAPVPHTTPTPEANVYGASFSMTNSNDPKRELATWLFLKYLVQPKPQAYWIESTGYLPTTKSTAKEMAPYFDKHPEYKVAFSLLDGMSEPSVPGYGRVRDEMSKALAAIYQGAPVDTVMKQLNEEANRQLKKQLAAIKQ